MIVGLCGYCEVEPCRCEEDIAEQAYRDRCLGVFDYQAQPAEVVDCNLCGWGHYHPKDIEALSDRYGLPQKADRCLDCGLVYLNPRMTREAYAEFYRSGAYRRLVSAFHGREINAQTIQPEQRVYAKALGDFLEPYVWQGLQTLLDIGGSTGVVAISLAHRFGLKPTVMDPAPEELALAGGETIPGFVEDYDPQGRRFDLVTMCQTADHVLDLMGTLKKVRSLLSQYGLFFVDIVDFEQTREVKIDHPYNLTRRTMREFLRRAGFDVVAERDMASKHIGFLCTRGAE